MILSTQQLYIDSRSGADKQDAISLNMALSAPEGAEMRLMLTEFTCPQALIDMDSIPFNGKGLYEIYVRTNASWATVSPWLASCIVNPDIFGCDRNELAKGLRAEGIDTRPLFEPIHRMPPYREAAKQRSTELPTTDRLADYGLMLPTYPQLSNDQVLFICDRIREHGTGSKMQSKTRGMQWLRAA